MQREVNGQEKQQSQLIQVVEENLTLKSRIHSLEESLRFSRGERADLELKLRHLTSNSYQAEVHIANLTRQCNELEILLAVSGRLLTAVTREDAIRAIQDIVANVIGAEEMAVFAMRTDRSRLEVIARCGVREEQCLSAASEEGVVARVWRSGVAAFPRSGDSNFTTCVPLRADRQAVAVLAIFSLLPQKIRLEPLDLVVLRFLEHHSGELLVEREKPTEKEQI